MLDQPVADINGALTHHGYVQIDPINICGRMHDLILRHRVLGYREGDLMRYLHGEDTPLRPDQRTAFEHHIPDANTLVTFPLDAWPHLVSEMQRRSRAKGPWSGKLTPRERALGEHILSEIRMRGELSSESIDDSRRARRVWGSATLAKSTLQKLFFHGRVLISRRVGQRRLYDLPERVLPPSVLTAKIPDATETNRWLIQLKLRQRRLVTLKREDVRVAEDLLQPIEIEDLPAGTASPPLFCLAEDAHTIASIQSEELVIPETIHLLAPLDPIIYDRRVTSAVWDFDYTWEAYTPAHKRVRGYYALPILSGLEIVGHVDTKADRKAGKLVVVSKSVRRGHKITGATKAFARWLGLKR